MNDLATETTLHQRVLLRIDFVTHQTSHTSRQVGLKAKNKEAILLAGELLLDSHSSSGLGMFEVLRKALMAGSSQCRRESRDEIQMNVFLVKIVFFFERIK